MQARRWQLVFSLTLTLGVIVLAYTNRASIIESFTSVQEAQPAWLLLALAVEVGSFFIASRVYHQVLRSLGYHVGALRLWGTALVAILLSQSVPAGGVASYAFLVQVFRRQNIPSGHSALLASLEALSYATAMLVLFFFSLLYLALYSTGSAEGSSLLAGGVAIVVIGAAVFILTRDQAALTRWLLALQQRLARLLGRDWSGAAIHRLIDELAHARALIATRRREVLSLVLVQLTALVGHSLAMLLVLYSLRASVSVFVVLTAFGIALISSTFNVLPGGGGTVETALALTLQGLGAGPQAITAAVIFRVLNFWLLAPVGLICYRWLIHGRAPTDARIEPEPRSVVNSE